jgi:hypothetical protein
MPAVSTLQVEDKGLLHTLHDFATANLCWKESKGR